MDAIWQDIHFAFRNMRKNLSVTLIAIVSLALAIAGNTVVFSVVNGMLYRPLPYPEAHRIMLVGEAEKGGQLDQIYPASGENFLDWQERQHSFEVMAAFRPTPVNLESGERSEAVNAAAVSREFFTLLGGHALHGRVFLPEETVEGNHRVAILSHGFWSDHHAAQPEVLGQSLRLNGTPYTVVGVMPEEFEFLDPTIRMWVPLVLERGDLPRQQRDVFVIGRLAPGVTDQQAKAEITSLTAQLEEEYPVANRGYTGTALNLREEIPNTRNRQLFALLQGALVFVLLIACANLANLLLARAHRREREIALRSSLGAGRRRIVRLLLTESLMLACTGGLVGLALGALGTRLIAKALAPLILRAWTPVIDVRVTIFTAAVAVFAGLLFGLVPLRQLFKLNLVDALKEGERGGSAGGSKRRLSSVLVMAEIAIALVLLVGSVLLIESFLEVQYSDPGFDSENLLTLQITLPEARYDGPEQRITGTESLLERLGAVPGVSAGTAANTRPRSPFVPNETFLINAHPTAEDEKTPRAGHLIVSPSYFETVGIPLVRGRFFTPADRLDSEPVVIVNQALAELYWPDGDVLGQYVTVRETSRLIVGVSGNVNHGFVLGNTVRPALYVPLLQDPPAGFALTLRAEVAPDSLVEPVRNAVLEVDPQLGVTEIQTLDDFLDRFFVGIQLFSTILGAFGLLALLLAMLGIYGVLAYTVALRTHEIGVRMAMGAGKKQILKMVTWQGLKLALIGLVIGVPGIVLVVKGISTALASVVPVEPLEMVGIGVLLPVVTVLASLVPARRAASVDPVRVLGVE